MNDSRLHGVKLVEPPSMQPLLSLVPRPSRGGRGREGLVSTACACAVILNNPITYGYCLVYLPFELNALCSTYLEMTGLDSSNFERDFEVA